MTNDFDNRRFLNMKEVPAYTSLGVTRATQLAKECGAVKRYGKRILVDRKILDKALDDLETVTTE